MASFCSLLIDPTYPPTVTPAWRREALQLPARAGVSVRVVGRIDLHPDQKPRAHW
jgi:hypothetical protein